MALPIQVMRMDHQLAVSDPGVEGSGLESGTEVRRRPVAATLEEKG